MNKIYNNIPGRRIEDSSIIGRIYDCCIDSVKYENWIEVNEKAFSLNFFTNNQEFYVLFLDPRGIIERLYITSCSDIMHFMKEHINIEYGEGVDIAICTKKIDNALICNHDGQIFLLNELSKID